MGIWKGPDVSKFTVSASKVVATLRETPMIHEGIEGIHGLLFQQASHSRFVTV